MTTEKKPSEVREYGRRDASIALIPYLAMCIPLGVIASTLDEFTMSAVFALYLVGGLPAVLVVILGRRRQR